LPSSRRSAWPDLPVWARSSTASPVCAGGRPSRWPAPRATAGQAASDVPASRRSAPAASAMSSCRTATGPAPRRARPPRPHLELGQRAPAHLELQAPHRAPAARSSPHRSGSQLTPRSSISAILSYSRAATAPRPNMNRSGGGRTRRPGRAPRNLGRRTPLPEQLPGIWPLRGCNGRLTTKNNWAARPSSGAGYRGS
jgi:hypothetical protein